MSKFSNFYIVIVKVFVIFEILFCLSSCKTLPSPDSKSDTLLIIPTEYVKEVNEDWFLRCEIKIEDELDGEVVKSKVLPNQGKFTVIKGLEPGKYRISQYAMINNDNERDYKNVNIKFELFPKKITVLNKQFSCRLNKKSDVPWMS